MMSNNCCHRSLWAYLQINPQLFNIMATPDKARYWEFLTPSDRWEVTHDFGRIPAFQVTDLTGNTYRVAPEIIDCQQIILTWQVPTTGYLYLN